MKVKAIAILVAALAAAALVVPLSTPGISKGAGKNPYGFADLSTFPKPQIKGPEIISGLEEYVDNYPLRQNGLPNNAAAAEWLGKEAEKYGFKTTIREYAAGPNGVRNVRVVESVKRGTEKPNEWIALVAHYDAVAPDGVGATVQGAYDPASGANMLRYFGKAFSKIKTKRSIALIWFDAEENGLLASKAYVENFVKKKGAPKIVAAMGFDMVGIAYPAPYCMCIYHGTNGPADAAKGVPIIDYVNKDFLKFPMGDGAPATAKWPRGIEGHVCNCGANIRNSDESSFANAGIFTMRWTGMRTASDYPGYHFPWDTVAFMEQVAGSRENLEQGSENTFVSAYYTTLLLDNLE
ncbi:MAG: hypothetical protein QOG16_660 [Actinomycetota bacterium]|jgi:hypothetical protein|nr:hypothetical protein [Actinomycetota bacterium]